MKLKTSQLTLCSIFAALSAVLSQIAVPIGPVPITLTHVSIFLAAGLLGAKYGTLSQVAYVIIGAIGLPVFSGFHGGLGWLLGPTGGFIWGYLICTFVTGFLIERLGTTLKVMIPAMYVGWLATYVCGVLWYMFQADVHLAAAVSACALPFLLGDVIKTVLSAFLVKRLKPYVLIE